MRNNNEWWWGKPNDGCQWVKEVLWWEGESEQEENVRLVTGVGFLISFRFHIPSYSLMIIILSILSVQHNRNQFHYYCHSAFPITSSVTQPLTQPLLSWFSLFLWNTWNTISHTGSKHSRSVLVQFEALNWLIPNQRYPIQSQHE